VFVLAGCPGVAAVAQDSGSRVDDFASVQTLSADIVAARSATAVLESWCRDRHLASDPVVVAHVAAGPVRAPSSAQLRRLRVADAHEVRYRRVRLECGVHLLSEADNWYVPARLTAEMNHLLDSTDTPFGKAIAPLRPSRETVAVTQLWADSSQPVPDALFEVHAVLYTRDHIPFSEVVETYRRGLVDPPSPVGVDASRDIRASRVAQNEAIAAGDLDRAAGFWTDDVTVRRALGQPLSGRAAARTALEPALPPAPRIVYERTTHQVDVSSQWPLAFETGTWEGHLESAAGPAVLAGRFSAQWVRRGGRWLIRSEVFTALTCAGVGCQAPAVP
jgi:ketosteroid isomerase-like protein/chorismate-pyruvate lyase